MMKSTNSSFHGRTLFFRILIASSLILVFAAGCTSAPSQTPEKFVLNFIQKHIPQVDQSVADFYVKEERAEVIDRVKKFIETKKKNGKFESISKAKYDFSNIKVDILDEKGEYVNDESVNFIKVAAKGTYNKTLNGKSESLKEDEIIILEAVNNKWKVTEKINPWL